MLNVQLNPTQAEPATPFDAEYTRYTYLPTTQEESVAFQQWALERGYVWISGSNEVWDGAVGKNIYLHGDGGMCVTDVGDEMHDHGTAYLRWKPNTF